MEEDSVHNLSNLFDIILNNDGVKHQVVLSGIKASLQYTINTPLLDGSKASTFKELLLEGKHSPKTTNAPIHEVNEWREYRMSTEEDENAHTNHTQTSRYDDPAFYDDGCDDTEAEQEGLEFRVVAARGVYKVNVGSCHVKANYPTQIVISTNVKLSELHFHFFSFVPRVFDGSSGGTASLKLANEHSFIHEDDTIMGRILSYITTGSAKEKHIANEFLNFLASTEFGITLKVDNISKVYFNHSTKHPGLGLIVLELREPAKKFRKRFMFSDEYMKRYYNVIPDWTKNQQASKHSRYYIVGEANELTAFITNMVSHSKHFRRAYYADRSFLQSTLDNAFFSVNDDHPAPKKTYKDSLAIPAKSTEAAPLASVESHFVPFKIPIPARLPSSPESHTSTEVSAPKMLVQLSPRNMPNSTNNSLNIQITTTPEAPQSNSLPLPLTPPVTPPENPWQTVANSRFSKFRNRPRALSSPNLFSLVQQEGANSNNNNNNNNSNASGSPRTNANIRTSANSYGSPRTGSPRTGSPRSGSPRTTRSASHPHKNSPKQLSPIATPTPSASTSPRSLLGDSHAGYSSESESASPRNSLKPSKLSSTSSPNNTPKPPPPTWKSAHTPTGVTPQQVVDTSRASRSYLSVLQNSIKPVEGGARQATESSSSSSSGVASSSSTTDDSITSSSSSGVSKSVSIVDPIPSSDKSAPVGGTIGGVVAKGTGSDNGNTGGTSADPIRGSGGVGAVAGVGVVKFFSRKFHAYESDSSASQSYSRQHIFVYDDDSDISSDEGGGLSSSSGDFSSDGSTQSSDGSTEVISQVSQPQRVPKININSNTSNLTTSASSTLKSSGQTLSVAAVSTLSTQSAPPLVVLSPRSSSSSSSPSTASPNSSPPCASTFDALVSPRRALVGPTGVNPVSPRSITPMSPRVPNASPRNLAVPLVFGSNPLSPRNNHPANSSRASASANAVAPRSARTIERRSSLLNIVPESPSSNFRSVNFLTEDEKVTRMNILQLLIHTGILPGDLSDYPIRNIHQLGTSAPAVNHKLGLLHKKISACMLDYLNFACRNVSELESKISDKYVYLYINGIDSDSDDEEQNARRRRLWNVGNSGKDSFRTTVELLNWLQYETTHSPVFYSICNEELVSRDFVRHCRKCRACFDWQYFHCNKCERCVPGINASEPHSCDRSPTEAHESQSETIYGAVTSTTLRECPEWPSMVAKHHK